MYGHVVTVSGRAQPRHLERHFSQHCLGKIPVVDAQLQEGGGSADDLVAIISRQNPDAVALRHDQAIDGDMAGQGFIASDRGDTADVGYSIANHVDDQLAGLPGQGMHLFRRHLDAIGDIGLLAVFDLVGATEEFLEPQSRCPGLLGSADLHPGQDQLVAGKARPGEYRKGDALVITARDDRMKTGVPQCVDQPRDLGGRLFPVNRLGSVIGDHNGDIDRLPSFRERRTRQKDEEQNKKHTHLFQESFLVMTLLLFYFHLF